MKIKEKYVEYVCGVSGAHTFTTENVYKQTAISYITLCVPTHSDSPIHTLVPIQIGDIPIKYAVEISM